MKKLYSTTQFPLKQLLPDEFPALLKEIPDKPSLLYIRGTMPSPELKFLCVVGSRAATSYGRRMTQKLIAGLARSPIAIISGMAVGIDSEAHKAAIDVGLPTVAILPSSCDDESLYPASNKLLAREILMSGGALVSENKAPFTAMLHSFPERNRVMAGMSQATLVIEAGEKSGTLITSRLALDYNRDVLAIPHELGKESGAGVNNLLRGGAILVRNSEDILEALGLQVPDESGQLSFPTDLNESEIKILEALTGPLVRDELIDAAALSAQEANIGLSSLLIRGLIIERLGKIERA